MAHQKYYTRDGVQVPSVTEILQILGSDAITQWANNLGIKGKSYKNEMSKAAEIGTFTHELIQQYSTQKSKMKIIDKSFMNKKVYKKSDKVALHCFDLFKQWVEKEDVNFVLTEKSIVSDKYMFGGTLDAVIKIGKELILVDYKTSKSIYEKMFLQLAGYAILLEEFDRAMYHDMDTFGIIRLDKKTNEVETYYLAKYQIRNYEYAFTDILKFYYSHQRAISTRKECIYTY